MHAWTPPAHSSHTPHRPPLHSSDMQLGEALQCHQRIVRAAAPVPLAAPSCCRPLKCVAAQV